MLVCIAAALSLAGTSRAAVVTDPPPPSNLPDVGVGAPLTGLTYSPDGKVLYTLDTTGELLGRNVQNQRTVFRGDTGAIGKIRFLQDGSLLIGQEDGTISWYEKPAAGKYLALRGLFAAPKSHKTLTDPRGYRSIFYQYEMEDFAPSPDGALLAVAITQTTWKINFDLQSLDTKSALLQVWDMRSKTLLHSWEPISLARTPRYPHAKEILHLAWEDNGKILDAAMPDVALKRFNPRTGELQSEWKPSAKDAIPPDPAARDAEMKRRFATLPPGLREDAQSAYEKRKADGATAPPAVDFGQTQALSADGKLLLAATPNGWQLWNIGANTNIILQQTSRQDPRDAVHFSADGSLLAVYDEGWFRLWKTDDGTRLGLAHVPFATFSDAAFSPRNKHLALADDTGKAREWTVASPLMKTASVVFPGFFDPWRHLSFTSELKLAATDRFVARLDSQGLPHWFIREPIKSPAPLSETEKEQTRMVIDHIAAAPDGASWAQGVSFQPYFSSLIMKGFPSSELRERDAKSGQIMWRQEAKYPMSHLEALRFLPDGTLLSGGVGHERTPVPLPDSLGGLQVHNAQNGALGSLGITWNKEKKPNGVSQLLASEDGKRIVVCSDLVGSDLGIQVIDLETKKVLLSFGGNTGIKWGKWALSPDGRWLGIAMKHRRGEQDHIYLRDLNKPRNGHFMDPPMRLEITSPAQAISFNKDGSFAVGLQDGRILMWAADPTEKSTPLWQTQPGRPINVLQFSADGKTLWSGDERGDLVARNAIDGQWKSTLRLLPPANENEAPSWARWTRGGKLVLGK